MSNWIRCLILIKIVQLTAASSAAPPLNNGKQQKVAPPPSPVTPTHHNQEVHTDSAASSSNGHPQYLLPPNQQQQQAPPMAYPHPGQHSPQVHQYLMQGNPMVGAESPTNSVADMKSDISSLRDTVMHLSNMVKDSMTEGRTAHNYGNTYANPAPTAASYAPPPKYEPETIQIEVVQPKKTYEEPAKPEPPKEEKKIEPFKAITSLFPSLSTSVRTNFVGSAERIFAIIKRGIKNALVTGIIVAIVRLLPLLWVGLRLIFNAILPLVGISLQGNTQFSRAFSLGADAQAEVTPARSSRSIFSADILDEELATLEDNFGIFKKM